MFKIRSEYEYSHPELTEIKIIIRVNHQQIYSNKLDNQDETDKFLEEHNPSKLKYKEIKNLKENFKI